MASVGGPARPVRLGRTGGCDTGPADRDVRRAVSRWPRLIEQVEGSKTLTATIVGGKIEP